MKVYHGSTQAVEYPLVGVGRENLDFGKDSQSTSH